MFDFLLEGSSAVWIFGDVEFVDFCLQTMQLVESGFDLFSSELLGLNLVTFLGTAFHIAVIKIK